MIYLELLWSFSQIGLFSIGGGYAAMPLIQSQVVEIHQWLTMTQFADIITIAEMTPGPIAINSATFVGTQDVYKRQPTRRAALRRRAADASWERSRWASWPTSPCSTATC